MNMNIKWTDEQTAFLIVRRSEGMTIPEICEKLNIKFKVNYNINQLYSKMGNLHSRKNSNKITARRKANKITKSISTKTTPKKSGKASKYMKYTQDKIDFVYACVGNNFPNLITIKGFKEQFDERLTARQIDYIIQSKRPSSARISHERKVEAEAVKSAKAFSIKLKPVKKEVKESLPEQLEAVEEVSNEIIEPSIYNRTRHHWTAQEERNLVLNFYELSIDEVRKLFQRPFYAIAKRLEMIVDSTEPKYITLLMEATKIITERKRMAANQKPVGFLKRRKQLKQAKKIAKMETKLSKLRGE